LVAESFSHVFRNDSRLFSNILYSSTIRYRSSQSDIPMKLLFSVNGDPHGEI
jgi:hypothetical protein